MVKYAKTMKKLYLKNGMFVFVKTQTEKFNYNRDTRIISVYGESNKGEKQTFDLIYSLQNSGAFNMTMVFAEGVTSLQFYEINHASEIIDNFDQYFNNLNQ